jgi:hypothetical protein
MKIYVVINNLLFGTSQGFVAAFKSKAMAKRYVNDNYKQEMSKWIGNQLDVIDCDDQWHGYVSIVTIDTSKLKY